MVLGSFHTTTTDRWQVKPGFQIIYAVEGLKPGRFESPVPVKLTVNYIVSLVILKLSLIQTALNRVMSQPCWPRRPRLVYKKHLNQLTLSPSFNHRLSSTFFAPFQFRLSASTPSLLPSHPPSPSNFTISLAFSCRPLLSPGGMRQFWRLAVCVMAWAPEMRILWWCWDYSSCSLGCTTLSPSSTVYILYVHRHRFPT